MPLDVNSILAFWIQTTNVYILEHHEASVHSILTLVQCKKRKEKKCGEATRGAAETRRNY